MDHSLCIATEDIILVPMSNADNKKYVNYRNGITSGYGAFINNHEVNEKQRQEWFEEYLKDKSSFMFSIYTRDGVFLGGNSIYNFESDKKTAEYGRLLVDKNTSIEQGIEKAGEKATKAALEIAKKRLNVENVYMTVWDDNIAAKRIYEKQGFTITESKEENGRKILVMEKRLV